MQGLEIKIVEGLLDLLIIAVIIGLLYSRPQIKKIVDAHLSAQQAAVANNVIDGLANIAEAVVQDFNQRIVASAKANGVFTPQLAQSVKQDAIQAVLSQGAGLISVGGEARGCSEAG
ncbi:hypothetical protein NZD89_06035 [Alicyclobacillus fastidiosus]|uniref:Uncharacterized protein n=1 Tax=Alicyclobacillus fastidiosus TaxID=392011 RepID=A0ABY6ZLK1_9BACL|nr:hypothetical protein [Alicyclobacillus fastidiosus]WAH42974.1 hypothetical protein NZD89_06035 [Alicyclobacillus fastidiosus]GMA64941.1 hypothetical protein GCM10025859_53810 [Alicyclobacillus fastidiosus]